MLKQFFRPAYHAVLTSLPDAFALSIQHLNGTGRWPNLKTPRTFNEKVLNRKLREQSSAFTRLADKVAVKAFVAERIGERFVTPTLWSGKAIPADAARRFSGRVVVKSNHTSNRSVFVDDAAATDWSAIRKKADGWLAEPWNPYAKERWYNRMERQILVEPFIGDQVDPPSDYKFFVFDGIARVIQFDTDRFSGHKRALFSPDWIKLPAILQFPPIVGDVPRPPHLDDMLRIAGELGRDFAFVRVDLYDLPDGPRFGEMTFAPGGGIERFTPASYDAELGAHWVGETV